jgi:hypothetical protein
MLDVVPIVMLAKLQRDRNLPLPPSCHNVVECLTLTTCWMWSPSSCWLSCSVTGTLLLLA